MTNGKPEEIVLEEFVDEADGRVVSRLVVLADAGRATGYVVGRMDGAGGAAGSQTYLPSFDHTPGRGWWGLLLAWEEAAPACIPHTLSFRDRYAAEETARDIAAAARGRLAKGTPEFEVVVDEAMRRLDDQDGDFWDGVCDDNWEESIEEIVNESVAALGF